VAAGLGASVAAGTGLEVVGGAGTVVPSAGGRPSADVSVSVPVTGVVPSPWPPLPPEPLPGPWLPVVGPVGSVPGAVVPPWPGTGERGPWLSPRGRAGRLAPDVLAERSRVLESLCAGSVLVAPVLLAGLLPPDVLTVPAGLEALPLLAVLVLFAVLALLLPLVPLDVPAGAGLAVLLPDDVVEGLEVLVDESVVVVGDVLESVWAGASVPVVAGVVSAAVVPVVVEPVVELPVVVVAGVVSGVVDGAVDMVVAAAVVVAPEGADPLPDPLLPQLATLVAAAVAAAAAVEAPSLVSHLAAAPAVVRLVAAMVNAAPIRTRRSPRPLVVPRDEPGRLGLALRTAARCVSMQETSWPSAGRYRPSGEFTQTGCRTVRRLVCRQRTVRRKIGPFNSFPAPQAATVVDVER